MGFYRQNERTTHRNTVPWRWLAVVAVSALVGAGTTALIVPSFQTHESVTTSASTFADESPQATPVSATVNVTVRDGVTQAVKKVEPAVMGVVNYTQVSDFFSQQTKIQATGVGTGVLFQKDRRFGFVATNNHVVQGAAKVEVVLGTGKHVQAEVVGTDPFTDLAVLKVPISVVKNIQAAQFANSDHIEVGEPAIAIGTPMGLDFADSVTAGIVSAKKRIMPVEDPQSNQTLDYQAVIQTDAAINPGNSGGPLLNIYGSVIGINSSKIVAQNFEGMGFAIPSNEVRNITEQIMATGHAVHPALGILGFSLSSMPEQYWPDVPVDYGVWIKSVTSKPAKASGIQPQDVIVGIDGHDVRTMADLRTYLFQVKPGQDVTLRVYRGSQQLTLKVKLGAMNSITTTDTQASANGGEDGGFDPFSGSPDGYGN